MTNTEAGGRWFWVSGLDASYNRPARAHVLKSHMSERSRQAKERAKILKNNLHKGVELPLRRPTSNMEGGKSSSTTKTATKTKGTPQELAPEVIRALSTLGVRRPSDNLVSYDFFSQNLRRYTRFPSRSGPSSMIEILYVETRNPELLILQRAVRGSAAVFYGIKIGDTAVVQEGHRWAISAICAVSKQLQLVQAQCDAPRESVGHIKRFSIRDLISASIILSIYECACGSNAWKCHLLGAEALILTLSPEKFQTGYDLSLFRTVRYGVLGPHILGRKPSKLASESWLTIPFANDTKTDIDTLVDILLAIPTCMRITDKAHLGGGHSAISPTTKLAVSQLRDVKEKLDRWWQDFALQTRAECKLSQLFPDLYERAGCPTSTLVEVSSAPQTRKEITDDLLIELRSKWDMGTLLALSMLATLELDPKRRHDLEIQCHDPGEKILAASSWIDDEDKRGNKAGSWPILLPLMVVSMVAPSPELRKRADSTLERNWREKNPAGMAIMDKLNKMKIIGANQESSESTGDL